MNIQKSVLEVQSSKKSENPLFMMINQAKIAHPYKKA